MGHWALQALSHLLTHRVGLVSGVEGRQAASYTYDAYCWAVLGLAEACGRQAPPRNSSGSGSGSGCSMLLPPQLWVLLQQLVEAAPGARARRQVAQQLQLAGLSCA
jgi:hypothetical protein